MVQLTVTPIKKDHVESYKRGPPLSRLYSAIDICPGDPPDAVDHVCEFHSSEEKVIGSRSMQDFYAGTTAPDKAFGAYSKIRTALNRHRSPPGSFLNIRLIADRLKVSATPVREALIRLANEDAIGFIRGRGYYTRALDVGELAADHEFATMIIKHSIEAGDRTSGYHADLQLANGWNGDPVADELQAANIAAHIEEFYIKVASRSSNRRVMRNMSDFCDRSGHVRQFGLMFTPAVQKALWSLGDLETALRSGDRGHAVRISQRHTRLILQALPNLVRDLNQRAEASRMRLEDLL